MSAQGFRGRRDQRGRRESASLGYLETQKNHRERPVTLTVVSISAVLVDAKARRLAAFASNYSQRLAPPLTRLLKSYLQQPQAEPREVLTPQGLIVSSTSLGTMRQTCTLHSLVTTTGTHTVYSSISSSQTWSYRQTV